MQEEIEEQVKGFVRRDTAAKRDQSQPVTANSSEAGKLVERITSASLSEIEIAVLALESMRRELLAHNERVQKELQAYEGLNQAAFGSLKSISETLAVWKSEGA
jgi:hypothetical protein